MEENMQHCGGRIDPCNVCCDIFLCDFRKSVDDEDVFDQCRCDNDAAGHALHFDVAVPGIWRPCEGRGAGE